MVKLVFLKRALLLILLGGYFYLAFFLFIRPNLNHDYPYMRARLGTILYHPEAQFGGKNSVYHLYCYYPSANISYPNRSGEYIIKRVSSLESCEGWYGSMTIPEGNWVSEREKLWWNDQRNQV